MEKKIIDTFILTIKAMAFDFISAENEKLTVEAEQAVCAFTNEVVERLNKSKGEMGENGKQENV